MMRRILSFAATLMFGFACVAGATELQPSVLGAELTSLRFGSDFTQSNSILGANLGEGSLDDEIEYLDGASRAPGQKSPTKAFLLSMAVPGAGQWYYGSKTRAVVFFGAEIATWALYLNFHSDGNSREDEFEAFNRAHWSRDAYEKKYLYNAYDGFQRVGFDYIDDDWVTATEVSHHLPDTRTQQYYEMTGKYDQFSWGWDDATLNGLSLDSLIALGSLDPITDRSKRPASANRERYEIMRDEANNAFSKANNMIIVGIVNRLVSGFEAYFVTKGRQSKTPGAFGSTLERVKVRADLKTYNSWRDTPFVTVAVKF